MTFSEFRKAGHPPTLLSAFLYFDVSFMVWVILGPLGGFIGWCSRQHRRLAMGIAGAGNSGTLVSTLFAARLAHAFGRHTVFLFAMAPSIVFLGAGALFVLKGTWRKTWPAEAAYQAGLISSEGERAAESYATSA